MDILGRLFAMLIFFAVCLIVFGIYIFVAAWAASVNGVSITKPSIPFVVLYVSAVVIPLFGGEDWLGVTGTEAEHEILKLFIVGLPVFFVTTLYFKLRYKMSMLVSILYALSCWLGAIAMSFCAFLIIVYIGSLFVIKTTASTTYIGATAPSKPAQFRCPNCHSGVNAGEDYCPACGTELGRDRKPM